MNDRIRVTRRPGPARQSIGRTAAAVLVMAALAVLMAACSGSPASAGPSGSSDSRGSTNYRAALAFSRCVRSHGVPNYPDPDSNGVLPKGDGPHFGVSNSQFQAADQACQHLLPSGSLSAGSLRTCYLTGDCSPALVHQALTQGVKFARCMRAHGVPDWPDPSVDSEGRPLFDIQVPRPAPRYMSNAINECSRLQPQGSLLAWG
jgi:hypothetical protein